MSVELRLTENGAIQTDLIDADPFRCRDVTQNLLGCSVPWVETHGDFPSPRRGGEGRCGD